MEQKRCWICGAGDFTSRLLSPKAEDLVLAADGGLAFLQKAGIVPSHILGDFDSLGYLPQGDNVTSFPPEKDDPDMLLAVKYGMERGCDTFYIYGSLGGRLAHTVSNVQALRYLSEQGRHGFLVDGQTVVTLIRNECVRFDAGCRGYLSVFPHGGAAEGVTISGMKYNVEDFTMTADSMRGLSNEFADGPGEISVQRGALLLLWEDAASDFGKVHFGPLSGGAGQTGEV